MSQGSLCRVWLSLGFFVVFLAWLFVLLASYNYWRSRTLNVVFSQYNVSIKVWRQRHSTYLAMLPSLPHATCPRFCSRRSVFLFPLTVVTTLNMHHREPDRAVENILRKLQPEDHGKCSVSLTLKVREKRLSTHHCINADYRCVIALSCCYRHVKL